MWLTQVVLEHTRVRGLCHSTLGLVFVRNGFTECTMSVEEGVSDHRLVFLQYDFNERSANTKPPSRRVKDVSRAKNESVLYFLGV